MQPSSLKGHYILDAEDYSYEIGRNNAENLPLAEWNQQSAELERSECTVASPAEHDSQGKSGLICSMIPSMTGRIRHDNTVFLERIVNNRRISDIRAIFENRDP